MLCLECGAKMRLVQVVEDTQMFVSGYEHHIWQCSACSTIEQRMTFTREKTPTPTVPAQPTPTESTQTVPVEPAHPKPPTAMRQTNVWLEKLRILQERATAAKEATRAAERRAQFNREWDNLLPLVPRFRNSFHRAARSFTNFGNRRTLANL